MGIRNEVLRSAGEHRFLISGMNSALVHVEKVQGSDTAKKVGSLCGAGSR